MSRSKHVLNVMMALWPLGKVLNRLGKWPVLGPLLQPCFDRDGNEAIIIPIHEAVHGTESVVLPFPLLTPLVERASKRFILHECLCRRGENCQTYPRQLGCLFLGDGAARIDPALGRIATENEALSHVQRAMDSGLVPLVVHSSLDAWLLGIPYHQALAVCFCCDCCCSVRQGLRLGPPAFWDTVIRLPGLVVAADPECTGCGTCAAACPVGAITLESGVAQAGGLCKGCGHCVSACPLGVMRLHLAQGADLADWLLRRVEERADVLTSTAT